MGAAIRVICAGSGTVGQCVLAVVGIEPLVLRFALAVVVHELVVPLLSASGNNLPPKNRRSVPLDMFHIRKEKIEFVRVK